MNFFSAIGLKITRVAFEQMRLVGSNDKQITRLKGFHVIPDYNGTLTTKHPGDLNFNMAMQVRIKKGQLIFLDMY